MSAETLRRAAALMRERAEAATPGRWERIEAFNASFVCFPAADDLDTVAATKILRADNRPGRRKDKRDAEHIASWHPAVAVAVADWLEAKAEQDDKGTCDDPRGCCNLCEHDYGHVAALAVANAYLGETP